MAVSFTSATKTVLGNQRALIGVVHMNDGDGYVNIGWRRMTSVVISPNSANSAHVSVKANPSNKSGQAYITSCTSGDAFNIIALGW